MITFEGTPPASELWHWHAAAAGRTGSLTRSSKFFFFLTKEYIHAIPHRQPWLDGPYLQFEIN